ncbi:hypothetical protein [Bacillus pinisoli]|uniref:hypothetical protein n=1 Tax=Bacillus pinisoli TaxID=2901866 RepID=UPI001FF57A38|nr:hypothetical protein [Bacillus pinisoli]
MEKTYHLPVEHVETSTDTIVEHSSFDEIMEKITNGMFKVILVGGIPYFLWIFLQFMFTV